MAKNKKIIWIIPISIVLLSSLVFADVTRSGVGASITYSTNMATTYQRAYWAVEEIVPSGCIISSVSCSSGQCSYSNGIIHAVGYTAESGGNMPSSISINIVGTGSCYLNNGHFVESYNDGANIVLGSSTILSQVWPLTLTAQSCNNAADKNTNCFIEDMELLDYMLLWRDRLVQDNQLLSVMVLWVQRGY